MEQDEIVRRAWETLEPKLGELGFELIEVEFGRHGAADVLRLFIDRPKGVTIDDCAAASRVVSATLDSEDFIESHYMLEVSSPGFARPIRKPKDFERFSGERIKLKTVAPVEGRKRFSGVLTGFADGLVGVETEEKEYRIHVENVKQAHLDR